MGRPTILKGVGAVSAIASPASQGRSRSAPLTPRANVAPHMPTCLRRDGSRNDSGCRGREVLAIAHAPRRKRTISWPERAGSRRRLIGSTKSTSLRYSRSWLSASAGRSYPVTAYSVEREKLLAEDRARWSQGQLPLPTAHQITRVTGSWGEALLRARLGGKSKPASTRKTDAPAAPDYDSWDYDSCVSRGRALHRAAPGKGARCRSTPADYNAWAATQDHAPEMHIIRHHCKTWAAARRDGMSRLS